MPKAVCVMTALPFSSPAALLTSSNSTGWVLPAIVRSPRARSVSPSVSTPVERKLMSWRRRTSSSMV